MTPGGHIPNKGCGGLQIFQAVFNFRALSGVSFTVILAELKINPKNIMSCVGIKIDFSGVLQILTYPIR